MSVTRKAADLFIAGSVLEKRGDMAVALIHDTIGDLLHHVERQAETGEEIAWGSMSLRVTPTPHPSGPGLSVMIEADVHRDDFVHGVNGLALALHESTGRRGLPPILEAP